jgi:hypothetical protein
MTQLLNFRETVKELYGKYDSWFLSGWKFLLSFTAFLMINGKMGYFEKLDSMFLILICALFCSILPINGMVLLGSLMIIGHLYGCSIPALLVGGGILVVLLLLYFGSTPGEGYPLVLTMVALAIGIPAVIPLVFGLISSPVSLAAIVMGTIAYYTLVTVTGGVQAAGATGQTAAEESQALVETIQKLLKGVFLEERMVLMVIAIVAALLVVYLIRKMAIAYAWELAIAFGTVTFLLVELMGCMLFGRIGSIPGLLFGTLFSVVVAFCVKFFLFHVDYKKSVQVQFEDNEYYYYVKAIPKIKKGRDERDGKY